MGSVPVGETSRSRGVSDPIHAEEKDQHRTAGDAGSLDPEAVVRTRRRLLRWGRANFRSFPWRHEQNEWLALAAEILLQRTRATQVQAAFPAFKASYAAPALLLEARENADEITRHLGLHGRVEVLVEVAGEIVRRGGSIPTCLETLCKMKGIGPYTAAAYLSLHRGKRAAIVDVNIGRWLSRMTGRRSERDPRSVKWLHALADELTPRRAFKDYNYAALDFSMTVCTADRPRCQQCPLVSDCVYGRLEDAVERHSTKARSTHAEGPV